MDPTPDRHHGQPSGIPGSSGDFGYPGARRRLREEGGAWRRGGPGCALDSGHWLLWGAAAWPLPKDPQRLKAPAKPAGAHPRLSLSEASRPHPQPVGSSSPGVGGPGAFFPAESTRTNADAETRSGRPGRRGGHGHGHGWRAAVRSRTEPAFCPPVHLVICLSRRGPGPGWRDGKACVRLSPSGPDLVVAPGATQPP